MTSTLWFWVVIIIILLILFGILRRFIGRIIILAILLFLLFWLFKVIAPTSANVVWYWIKDIPAKTVNYINKEVLKKDIVLPLTSEISGKITDGVDAISDTIESINDKNIDDLMDTSDNIIEEEQLEEDTSHYSWFARLFKRNKKTKVKNEMTEENSEKNKQQEIEKDIVNIIITGDDTKENQEEKIERPVEVRISSGSIIIESSNTSGEKEVEEVVNFSNNEDKETIEANNSSDKENVISENNGGAGDEDSEEAPIYLPSNPKNSQNTTSSTTTSVNAGTVTTTKGGLTNKDIQEANSIFN